MKSLLLHHVWSSFVPTFLSMAYFTDLIGRLKVLEFINPGHLSITKCRAKISVSWSDLPIQIENLIKNYNYIENRQNIKEFSLR